MSMFSASTPMLGFLYDAVICAAAAFCVPGSFAKLKFSAAGKHASMQSKSNNNYRLFRELLTLFWLPSPQHPSFDLYYFGPDIFSVQKKYVENRASIRIFPEADICFMMQENSEAENCAVTKFAQLFYP